MPIHTCMCHPSFPHLPSHWSSPFYGHVVLLSGCRFFIWETMWYLSFWVWLVGLHFHPSSCKWRGFDSLHGWIVCSYLVCLFISLGALRLIP
jgi:hypothetical protein